MAAFRPPDIVTRIFWRRGLTTTLPSESAPGWLVGWTAHHLTCCVVAIVPAQRCSLGDMERFLGRLRDKPELQSVWTSCGGSPTVLGQWEGVNGGREPLGPADDAAEWRQERMETSPFWLTMRPATSAGGLPVLRDVMIYGYHHHPVVQIILFSSPHRLKYFASRPFALHEFPPHKTTATTDSVEDGSSVEPSGGGVPGVPSIAQQEQVRSPPATHRQSLDTDVDAAWSAGTVSPHNRPHVLQLSTEARRAQRHVYTQQQAWSDSTTTKSSSIAEVMARTHSAAAGGVRPRQQAAALNGVFEVQRSLLSSSVSSPRAGAGRWLEFPSPEHGTVDSKSSNDSPSSQPRSGRSSFSDSAGSAVSPAHGKGWRLAQGADSLGSHSRGSSVGMASASRASTDTGSGPAENSARQQRSGSWDADTTVHRGTARARGAGKTSARRGSADDKTADAEASSAWLAARANTIYSPPVGVVGDAVSAADLKLEASHPQGTPSQPTATRQLSFRRPPLHDNSFHLAVPSGGLHSSASLSASPSSARQRPQSARAVMSQSHARGSGDAADSPVLDTGLTSQPERKAAASAQPIAANPNVLSRSGPPGDPLASFVEAPRQSNLDVSLVHVNCSSLLQTELVAVLATPLTAEELAVAPAVTTVRRASVNSAGSHTAQAGGGGPLRAPSELQEVRQPSAPQKADALDAVPRGPSASSPDSGLRRRRASRPADSDKTRRTSTASGSPEVGSRGKGVISAGHNKLPKRSWTSHLVMRFVLSMLHVCQFLVDTVDALRIARISATAFQIRNRLTQLCALPSYRGYGQRICTNSASSNRDFMALWSFLCRWGIDFFCGWLLGAFLIRYSDRVLDFMRTLNHVLESDVLRQRTLWLMGAPADVKVNADLTHALGGLVLSAIDAWDALTSSAAPLESVALALVALSGVFGITIMLTVAADLLALRTVHVTILHRVFGRLFTVTGSALWSLFTLFRGKKRNPLRNRIDHYSYDRDQVVLGTLLFALLFFLFPTIAVYYIFFSGVQLLVACTQGALWATLDWFNCFPFFPLLVYVVDQDRLPGGIRFDVVQPALARAARHTYLSMHSSPLPLSVIFRHYVNALRRIASAFSPLRLMATLLRGEVLDPRSTA